MKPKERTHEESAKLLMPDCEFVIRQAAIHGAIRNEQDIYFGKVKRCSAKEWKTADFCWCSDVYESEKISTDISPHEYCKRIICVPSAGGDANVFAARDVEVEEIKPGSVFEYDGACRMLPRHKALEDPYVMSLADALEMYRRFGFVNTEIGDIFIGTFSFKNFNAENTPAPDARKHFGVGLSYMVFVTVDGQPCVAVVCAFNETRPKTVICNPLSHSVIRNYRPDNAFRTVCGRMKLVNGVMTRC